MNELINQQQFTTPKLVKSTISWYVEFYFLNPSEDKMKRFRITENLNRSNVSPTLSIKKQNFNELLEKISEQLENGWNPLKRKILEPKLKRITLKEAKPVYIELIKDLRPKTRVKYISVLNRLILAIGENVFVDQITNEDLVSTLKFLENNSKTGSWRNASFNSNRVDIFNFFAVMKRNKYIQVNPVDGIKMRKKQTTQNHQIFSDADLTTILNHLDFVQPQTALYVRCLYYTCIRPNELRQLKVKHVNLERKVIIVPDYISKNKEEGYVNIDAALLVQFEKFDINQYNQEDYLFTSLQKKMCGSKILGYNTIYRRFMLVLDELNLNHKDYTLYSLKHTSNCKKYKAGWTIAEICAANRHKSLVETETYLKSLLKDATVTRAVPCIG